MPGAAVLQLAPLHQLSHTPVMLVHSQGCPVHSYSDAVQSCVLAFELGLSVQCESLQFAQDLGEAEMTSTQFLFLSQYQQPDVTNQRDTVF